MAFSYLAFFKFVLFFTYSNIFMKSNRHKNSLVLSDFFLNENILRDCDTLVHNNIIAIKEAK